MGSNRLEATPVQYGTMSIPIVGCPCPRSVRLIPVVGPQGLQSVRTVSYYFMKFVVGVTMTNDDCQKKLEV